MRKLKVFVASPGDVPQERDIVTVVVDELRRTVASLVPTELETVRWETHAWPDIGEDAQDVINREIGDYDVFVGVMWKRFGTPTKRSLSGTGEEFERAYSYFRRFQRPKVMFYFRAKPFFTTDLKEIGQFRRVTEFRKRLEKFGVLFWEYSEPIEFERRFREHLTRQILQLANVGTPASIPPKIFLSYKRQDIDRVEPIYEALKAEGFNPWMDVRDILPGGQWVFEIESAIKRADFFVTFVSQYTANGTRSVTGFSVSSEIGIALKKFELEEDGDYPSPDPRSYLIPVRLDPVDPPARLAQFQWIDLFAPSGLQRLVETVRKVWQMQGIDKFQSGIS